MSSQRQENAAGGRSGAPVGHPPDRVQRSVDLSQQIADRLRDDIIHGRIQPGVPLVQEELCERFGTSRAPIRDALQQLTHEGMAIRSGHQRVAASVSLADAEEIELIMAVLHGWAAGRAARLASDEELAELEEICRAGIGAEDPYEWANLAMRFHRRINLAAKAPHLLALLRQLQQTVPQTHPFLEPDAMESNKAAQLELLKALRARDGDTAERLTRASGVRTVSLLSQILEVQRRTTET